MNARIRRPHRVASVVAGGTTPITVALILGAAAFGACGPSSDEADPTAGATRQWDAFRRNVAESAAARGAERVEARRNVCAGLAGTLVDGLVERHGGTSYPDCTFIDNVPAFDGDTRFGPLEDARVREEPYPRTVIAQVVLGGAGGGARTIRVEVQEPNPGNWEISRLSGLP